MLLSVGPSIATVLCSGYPGTRLSLDDPWRPRGKLSGIPVQPGVWASKPKGHYYCPDSKLYGGTETGRDISQGQALQAGYRPAAEECSK